jgi:hypothetical protein
MRRLIFVLFIVFGVFITSIQATDIEYHEMIFVFEGSSIQTAIDGITDASWDKRYLVLVQMGDYFEDITIPAYVGVMNMNMYGKTTLRGSASVGTDLVTMQNNSHLAGIILQPTTNKDSAIEITGSNVKVSGIGINGGEAVITKGISLTSNQTNINIWNSGITQVQTGLYITDGAVGTRDLFITHSIIKGIDITGGTMFAYNTVVRR